MKLTPFADALPILRSLAPTKREACYDYYEVTMEEFLHQFHQDLPLTKVWGYDGQFPGPLFDVKQGRETRVKWMNNLPDEHLLPIDRTLHSASEHMPDVRTVVHLHGAEVEADSDGYPEA